MAYIKRICVHLAMSVLFLISRQKTVEATEESKRILLNDPDTATKIIEMDKTIKAQTHLLTQLSAKIDAQETELTHQQSMLQAQHLKIEGLKHEIDAERLKSKDIGSTYVRWGRTDCSGSNTTLLYSGFTTGQHYNGYSNHFGGPANFLCLPSDPQLSNITLPGDSFLYGSEYMRNTQRSDAAYEDVPCAVCKSSHSAHVMIPGRTSCYSGWNEEYAGLLASGHLGHSASNYICIDQYPEYIQGGQTHVANRELYYTQTACGALPCPPYKDKHAVNCVVCTQ